MIFALTYAVGAAELAHCIVGSAETLYVVFNGEESLWAFLILSDRTVPETTLEHPVAVRRLQPVDSHVFPSDSITHFLAPATLGNTVGGVVLVAVLNYSQTRNRRLQDRDRRGLTLDWSEWLFGNHIGQPVTPSFSSSEDDSSEPD